MPVAPCRLCGLDSELQLSHILPAFAYRWLRESSGNGHLRNSLEPNKRVQDGLKLYWLCTNCEKIFSKNETAFAGKLFHPYLSASGRIFPYSSWLIQFCTSVSWRILRFYLDEGHLKSWEPAALRRIATAELVWRDLLLGKRPHPGEHQQLLLPLDRISETTGDFSPNINRYLMRAIQLDICRGSESIFTYAKLGRFIIVGFVHEPNMTHWRGAKVHASHGYLEPRKFVLPKAFVDYLNEKAHKMNEALSSMSDRQYEKVDQTFRANIDRFIGSDAFIAMQADIEMYGDEAFTKRPDLKRR